MVLICNLIFELVTALLHAPGGYDEARERLSEIHKRNINMSENKVAIMTGTGQGIGRGCAIEMAKAGYKVSLMSPSKRSIELAQSSIPAQRPATFEEIGQACVFLASRAARYINGQSILSDGGMNRAVR